MFYWDVATGRVIRKFRGHGSEVIFFLRLFNEYMGCIFQLYLCCFCFDVGECCEI